MENVDELINWKKIDQLHNATLNFSKNSLEIKKLLFVVIGITTPLIINVCDNKLNTALFVSLYIILLVFWIFDSYTYYYQKKLRYQMDDIFVTLRNEDTSSSGVSTFKMVIKSLFNFSHLCFYGVLLIIVAFVNGLYGLNIIS